MEIAANTTTKTKTNQFVIFVQKFYFFIIATWRNQPTEVLTQPFEKTNRHLLLMIRESISLWRKSSSPSLNALVEAKEWEVGYGRGFIIEVNIQRRTERRGLGKRITVLKTFLSLISFHQLWVTKRINHIFLAYLKKGKALCSWQRRMPP